MKTMPIGNNNPEYTSSLKKVAKGAGINLSGAILGKAIVFINTLLLARLLNTAELGLYFLGLSITAVATIVALMGLRIGVVRFISIYSSRGDLESTVGTVIATAGLTLACSILIASLLFITQGWLSTAAFDKPSLGPVLAIFALSIPFEALYKVLLSATQGLKFMHYTVYVEQIVVALLRTILFLILVWGMKLGVKGAAIGYCLSAVGGMMFAVYFCVRVFPHIGKDRKIRFQVKELLRFSLLMLPSTFVFNVAKQVDTLMLGWLGSAATVGIYTVAVRLIGFIEVIFGAFQTVFNPFIADLHSRRELLQLSRLFSRVTKWALMVTLPLFVAFFFFPTFFMGLFSREISSGAICLVILVGAQLLTSPSGLASAMIFMSGRANVTLANNIFFVIVNVMLNYFLIPRYGLLGAAMSHGIAMSLLAIIRFGEVLSIMKIHPFQAPLLKPVFAAFISSLPIYLYFGSDRSVSWPAMFSSMALFFVLYVTMIVLFKLDEDDLHLVGLARGKASRILACLRSQ